MLCNLLSTTIRAPVIGIIILAETRNRKGSKIANGNLGIGFLTDFFGRLSIFFIIAY